MKRAALFFSMMLTAVISNAMDDHIHQLRGYIQTHEWLKLIGYMVDNNLSGEFLLQAHPEDLDLGVGHNRFLVKFMVYICSHGKNAQQKEAATAILKSLITAKKFDLDNIDGFEKSSPHKNSLIRRLRLERLKAIVEEIKQKQCITYNPSLKEQPRDNVRKVIQQPQQSNDTKNTELTSVNNNTDYTVDSILAGSSLSGKPEEKFFQHITLQRKWHIAGTTLVAASLLCAFSRWYKKRERAVQRMGDGNDEQHKDNKVQDQPVILLQ